jgi:hypothetical protein
MFATGVISQSNMNALEQFAGPQKAAQMKQIMQAKKIQIMSDEPAAPVGMRNAVFRPEDGAPAFQQAQSMDDYVATGRPARGKSPMQSPLPGSAQVPTSVIAAQEGAKEQAAADVKMRTAPQIEAATTRTKNLEALRVEQPKAKVAAESNIRKATAFLNDIDEYLRNKSRNQIFGKIDGMLSSQFMTDKGAYALAQFNRIKQASVIKDLIGQRQETTTGAAPLGTQTTNQDATRVEQAVAALDRFASYQDNDKEILKLRDIVVRAAQRERDMYEAQYGPVLKGNPNARLNVPAVPAAYKRSQTPQGGQRRPLDQVIKFPR